MIEINRSPARISTVVSIVSGSLVVTAVSPFGTEAISLAALGLLLSVTGFYRRVSGLITAGATGLFLGTLAAGMNGAPVAVILFCVVAAVLAWETGHRAVDIGRQLGQNARTSEIELFSAARTAAVGILTGGAGFLTYQLGTGGQPLSALVVLVLAVVCLFAALRRVPHPT